MKIKLLFNFLAGFLILILAGFSYLMAQSGSPQVVFKEKEWNFGKIKQGEVVSHEFIFHNGGTAPLKIIRVTTSCGCTAALVSETEIAPGRKDGSKLPLIPMATAIR